MDRDLEFRVIEAAYAEGVLVPKPYFLGDTSLGVPFFIMERIEGETIPRRLFRDRDYSQARHVMTKQLGARLARIHRVPLERYHLAKLSGPQAGNSPAEEEITRYEAMYETMARAPPCARVGLSLAASTHPSSNVSSCMETTAWATSC
jgi:aminoglycoside phosphotransferase (APT) family kinase protein